MFPKLIMVAATAVACTACAVYAEAAPSPTPSPITRYYPPPPIPIPSSYRVHKNDSLSKIAKNVYGSASAWPALWWVNRHRVHDPGMILIGQWLHLSPWHPQRGWLRRAAMAALSPSSIWQVPSRGPSFGTPLPVDPAAGILSFLALERLWVSAGGPVWAEEEAAAKAECESGGKITAYNTASGASGIWQILGQVVAGYIFDPMINALNAVAKFRASGNTFAQWEC